MHDCASDGALSEPEAASSNLSKVKKSILLETVSI